MFIGCPCPQEEEDDILASGLDPANFLAMSRVKGKKNKRRRRRRKRPGDLSSSSSSHGHKEVLEVKSAPRAEFLIPGIYAPAPSLVCAPAPSPTPIWPESYDAEPDCAPSGSISGLTFLNFAM